ncbi:MAG: hypothetical protein ACTS78_03415 [Arsenophonus sp. NC-WZS1-MAG3]
MRRIRNVINKSIFRFSLQYVDCPLNLLLIDGLTELMNRNESYRSISNSAVA